MSNFLDEIMDLTDVPGIDGESVVVYEPLQLEEIESNPNNRKPDLEDDYSVVRQSLHHQNQMLMDAAKIFLETAKNADSPRHMEVFSTLIGQMTTTNKEILRLHKEMKDITSEQVGTTQKSEGVNINANQVFLGSPTDLMMQDGDAFEASNRNYIDGEYNDNI